MFARQDLASHIRENAHRKALGKLQQQVQRLQGKVDPAALKKYAAVPGLIQQVVAQQVPQVFHDLRQCHGMQPVAAEIAMDSLEIEAAGIAADPVLLFEHRDAGDPFLDKLVSCADAGRAGAENHYVLFGR